MRNRRLIENIIRSVINEEVTKEELINSRKIFEEKLFQFDNSINEFLSALYNVIAYEEGLFGRTPKKAEDLQNIVLMFKQQINPYIKAIKSKKAFQQNPR